MKWKFGRKIFGETAGVAGNVIGVALRKYVLYPFVLGVIVGIVITLILF